MKTFAALIAIFHLCRSSALGGNSVSEEVVAQSDKMQQSRDLYDLLRSFYRNRARDDKESIENARKEALKQYEKEKEEAITKNKRPNPLSASIVSYYNRLIYWLSSKEHPSYERSLEYFIPTARCAFLQDSPNAFLEAYATFFDEFSYGFFKHHLGDSVISFLEDNIESLRLQKELPRIFSERQDLGWNDYHVAIDKRLEELMSSFALRYGIQDLSLEDTGAERTAN